MTEDEKLDADMFALLEKLGLNPKLTKASGQVRGDGDITAFPFMVEDKYRSVDSFSITGRDFRKAVSQAVRQGLKPLLCRRNKQDETIVAMDLKLFSWLVNSAGIAKGRVHLTCPDCQAETGFTEELTGEDSEAYVCKCGMGALIQYIRYEEER